MRKTKKAPDEIVECLVEKGWSTRLPFRELEPGAGSPLSVLLALFHARIARKISALTKGRFQIGIIFKQRSGNSVAQCPCLPRKPATIDFREHIKLAAGLGGFERLLDNHCERLATEVFLQILSVYGIVARSPRKPNASKRAFAPSGAFKNLLLIQLSQPPVYSVICSGF